MSVWAESNQPVNPWQPKLIFFFPFWRNSPASPASTDCCSSHEIITSTNPPSSSSTSSSSSSRLYKLYYVRVHTHDDIDFSSNRLFFHDHFPGLCFLGVFFMPTQGHLFHEKNQPSSLLLLPADPLAGIETAASTNRQYNVIAHYIWVYIYSTFVYIFFKTMERSSCSVRVSVIVLLSHIVCGETIGTKIYCANAYR